MARPASATAAAVDLRSLLIRRCEDHGVAPPAGPPIPWRGDADLVGIALDNLIRNAVEAAGAAAVTVTWAVRDQQGELRVINPGQLPPGVRLTAMEAVVPASTKSGGLGLGLALTQHIARLHGGQLTLTDTEGHVTAMMHLPVAP